MKRQQQTFSPQSPSPESIEDYSQIRETQLVPEQTNNFSTQQYCEMLSKLASQAAETIPKPIWPNSTNILELVNHVLEKADDKNAVKMLEGHFQKPSLLPWMQNMNSGWLHFKCWMRHWNLCPSNTLKTPRNQEMAGKPSPVCRVFLGDGISQLCFVFVGGWKATEQDLGWNKFRFFFVLLNLVKKERKREWGCGCVKKQMSCKRKKRWVLAEPIQSFFVTCWVLSFFEAGISSHFGEVGKSLFAMFFANKRVCLFPFLFFYFCDVSLFLHSAPKVFVFVKEEIHDKQILGLLENFWWTFRSKQWHVFSFFFPTVGQTGTPKTWNPSFVNQITVDHRFEVQLSHLILSNFTQHVTTFFPDPPNSSFSCCERFVQSPETWFWQSLTLSLSSVFVNNLNTNNQKWKWGRLETTWTGWNCWVSPVVNCPKNNKRKETRKQQICCFCGKHHVVQFHCFLFLGLCCQVGNVDKKTMTLKNENCEQETLICKADEMLECKKHVKMSDGSLLFFRPCSDGSWDPVHKTEHVQNSSCPVSCCLFANTMTKMNMSVSLFVVMQKVWAVSNFIDKIVQLKMLTRRSKLNVGIGIQEVRSLWELWQVGQAVTTLLVHVKRLSRRRWTIQQPRMVTCQPRQDLVKGHNKISSNQTNRDIFVFCLLAKQTPRKTSACVTWHDQGGIILGLHCWWVSVVFIVAIDFTTSNDPLWGQDKFALQTISSFSLTSTTFCWFTNLSFVTSDKKRVLPSSGWSWSLWHWPICSCVRFWLQSLWKSLFLFFFFSQKMFCVFFSGGRFWRKANYYLKMIKGEEGAEGHSAWCDWGLSPICRTSAVVVTQSNQ